MCGLCGVLGGVPHWTHGVSERDASGASRTWLRNQARQRSVALANEVLRRDRVIVHDWQATSFIVTGPTGRTEIAPDPGRLWSCVQIVLGRPLDPLDPDFLEALDG